MFNTVRTPVPFLSPARVKITVEGSVAISDGQADEERFCGASSDSSSSPGSSDSSSSPATALPLKDLPLSVVFEECTVELGSLRPLRIPLPRPVGTLRTTYCDAALRISRGGRGGVFILKRLAL